MRIKTKYFKIDTNYYGMHNNQRTEWIKMLSIKIGNRFRLSISYITKYTVDEFNINNIHNKESYSAGGVDPYGK